MIEVDKDIVALVEGCIGGAPFAAGDVVRRPEGRMVEIVDGQYWGSYGISNFWHWREVLDDGGRGELESGYGWIP